MSTFCRALCARTILIALTACSPPADTPGGYGPSKDAGGYTIGCANDSRADAYRANLTKVGVSKALTFVLVAGVPAPPAIDNNTWTLSVLDSNGNRVQNAAFPTIKTWMPDHEHGSPEVPAATSNGDGTYTVQQLYFFMPGLWQITFTAQAGAASDSATFSFCIGG